MKTKFNGFLTLLLAFMVQLTFAQEKNVTGTVTDESGPLPGVSIIIKGTTSGTETDFDGNYSIKASAGDVLKFSFIGMSSKEVTVGASNTINVVLEADNVLEEVIVTALGIERNPKELSYAVTSLKSDELTKTKAVNVATAMVGKVSGLQINTVNNSVNAETRVVLRGNRSLLGNNQALIVIDGFPSARGVLDRINPNDIDNISVLKGSNAAALYGSEASNGVIIITTKKGKGKLSVEFSSSYTAEKVAYLPELQEEFGAGGFPDGTIYPLENVNWGPRYDGQLVDASETLDNGEVWQVPYSAIKNRNRDFFNTGSTIRNGVTVSGGDENGDFLMSIDQSNVEGVMPKDTYNRTNFRLKGSRTFNKLRVGGNLSFFRSHANLVGEGGRQDRPVYWNVLNTPLHLPLNEMKNWQTGKFTRNEVSFFRFYENPWFIIDTQREYTDRNEFNIVSFADYDVTDWLTASLTMGYTGVSQNFKRKFGAYTYAFHLANTYSEMDEYGARTYDQTFNSSRFNSDFILKFNKDITEDFNVKLILGQNMRITNSKQIDVSGSDLIIPDFWNVSTRTGDLIGSERTTDYRKVGVYGDVTFGYKDFLYVSGTGRNDWSSALPVENNSYFYYGTGLSLVLTNAIPSLKTDNGFSYLKLNANYTKTGNDAGAYQSNNVFVAPNDSNSSYDDASAYSFPYGTTVGLSQSSRDADPGLSPEFTTSIEAGIEMGFFRNRLIANISAYQTNSTDQIAPINVASSSGALSSLTNIGEIENQGLEVELSGDILKNEDFNWNVGVNYSGYKSEVISLSEGVQQVDLGGYSTAQVIAEVGSPYPLLRTTAYERDPQGRVIVGANGDPLQDSDNQTQGQTAPKYIVGLTTSVRYKGFSLYAAMDYRTGHVFYNQLVDALEFTGLSQHSVSAGRQPFVFPNSSYNTGTDAAPVYVANTNRLTSDGGNAFWDEYNNVKENYVTDATTLKLREVQLSYNLDEQFVNSIGFQDIQFGIFGRNLLTFRPKDNVYSDPEFNFTTGNAVGVGNQSQGPPTRQYGLNLTITF
ncbi:SusC/RagA family TonB-linked outer membrane protein [Aureibaculum algae]|uniref:SusC/RagA family TonB-linked outer membrane protein n=1 Tax=Aureibaculum algae TaxID=2584122 RepID=A0A5B7TZH0_9FLAO|nr:SusC/RagA family TonB-linked outer membrane protein [Aureibaculum algae]QCX40082.1 SusC/RagA family TonB-linked outer membrane protein [Aureibaculum algae]